MLQDLEKKLNFELSRQLVSTNVLLSRLSLLNEGSRLTPAYQDPRYIPFYYYLGKYITPKNLLEIGANLGFFSSAFLKSCKTVENILIFEKKQEVSDPPRFAIKNIKMVYKKQLDWHYGKILDVELQEKLAKQKYDLCFFNEKSLNYDEYRIFLDIIWERISEDGLLVFDFANDKGKVAYEDFCKTKNRDFIILKTRYGTGLMRK